MNLREVLADEEGDDGPMYLLNLIKVMVFVFGVDKIRDATEFYLQPQSSVKIQDQCTTEQTAGSAFVYMRIR